MALSYGRDTSGRTTVTKEAEAALTQYRFVKKGTADNQVLLCGAGENAIGVVEASFPLGEQATVYPQGLVYLTTGGVIGTGVRVKSGANGVALAAGATEASFGIALQDGASGETIRVQLDRDTNTHA